jgi:NADPH:quinone reductase-like Zn-dependent oxidoreductase
MRSPWTPRSEVVDTGPHSPGRISATSACANLWTAEPAVDQRETDDAEDAPVILVVEATGQVGSLVVRLLRAGGAPVRAMVRDPSSAADLAATELAVADLGSPDTLDSALEE